MVGTNKQLMNMTDTRFAHKYFSMFIVMNGS